MKVHVTRTTVYLAGKISKDDWRGSLPHKDWDGAAKGTYPNEKWIPRELGDNLLVTGPFWVPDAVQTEIARLALSAILDADVFFWRIEGDEICHMPEPGTWLAEYQMKLGLMYEIAVRSGKRIVYSVPEQGAHQGAPYDLTAHDGLLRLDASLKPEPTFASPVEKTFWKAFQGRPLAASMQAQFVFKRQNGATFRPDFSFPELRIAVEIDGFKYHTSPEQFSADLARQREMEQAGWRFIRFTGQEVNADAAACVKSVEDFVALVRA